MERVEMLIYIIILVFMLFMVMKYWKIGKKK